MQNEQIEKSDESSDDIRSIYIILALIFALTICLVGFIVFIGMFIWFFQSID